MKDNKTLKWIFGNSKQELSGVVLLVISNALFSACGVSFALFAKFIIDAAQNGDMNLLIKNALILLAIIVFQIILRMSIKALEVRVSGRLEMRYKSELFSQILKKDYMKITEYHSGELMTRLTSDVTVVCDAVTTILPAVVSMVTRLVCAFAVLFLLDRFFAILFIIAGVVIFVVTRLFRGSMKKYHRRVQETDGKVRSFMQETIESLLVIKIFNVSKKMRNRSEDLQKENYDAKLRRNRWSILANTGFSMAFSFGYLIALVWGGVNLCTGTFSFGTLTAIMQLVNQVQTPFTNLSGIIPQYYSMLTSAERIMEIESLESSKAVNNSKIDTAKVCDELECIRFNKVSFSYDRDVIINNGSFKIEKNDFIIISGISGIGKSTLFKLLVGVLPPDDGEIFIESGKTKYGVDKYTRPLFAYVPQGNMLFSGTIRDNIKFINENATDEEVMRAARISCAEEFINDLPQGLDTMLHENGHGLSEGQIQRLAVARAVLTDAPVLLLDEATSALDEQTEKQLLSNIRDMSNKTCIIISHKNAAYEICNKELKIADKKISIRNLISKNNIV